MTSEKKYICSARETFDLAALRIYGDEKYASVLLGANPEHCHKLIFQGGEELYVPDVDVPEDDDEMPISPPPWKM